MVSKCILIIYVLCNVLTKIYVFAGETPQYITVYQKKMEQSKCSIYSKFIPHCRKANNSNGKKKNKKYETFDKYKITYHRLT